jgi:hypothetical protein
VTDLLQHLAVKRGLFLASIRPQLFLDTNVCGKLTVPPHSQYALHFMAEVRKRYRIAVAATTVSELLRSPRPGTEAFFSKDQKKFRACICGSKFVRYLGLPVDFAMTHILGVIIPDRIEPSYFVTVQVAAKVVSRKSFKIFILDLAIS